MLSDLRGRIDLILDGGPTLVGIESTIVACLDRPALLRPGGAPREAIERALGTTLADAPAEESDTPLAPGMLASHYAPRARLRLNARDVRDGEALLAFGPRSAGRLAGAPVGNLNLSHRAILVEAAANLFSHLRTLGRSQRDHHRRMRMPMGPGRRTIVLTPRAGWRKRSQQGKRRAELVPRGKDFHSAPALMYVKVSYRRDKEQTVEQFVDNSQKRWRESVPDTKIEKLADVTPAAPRLIFYR